MVAQIQTSGGEIVIDQDVADGVYSIAFLSSDYIRSCPKTEDYPPWRMPLDEFLKAVNLGVQRLRSLGPKKPPED